MPGDAHRHGQDHHVFGADHVVPARAPGVRQAHLLHAHSPRDGEGAGGAARAAGVPREARRQGFGNHGARPEQPQEHVHPPQGRGRGLERERGRAVPPVNGQLGTREAHRRGFARGGDEHGAVSVFRGLREGGAGRRAAARGVHPGGPARVRAEKGVVSVLPGAAHDRRRERGGVQLPVPAGSEGVVAGVARAGEGVRGGLRRGAQHRQRVYRGALREPQAADAGRRGAEHHQPQREDRAREADGRAEAPRRVRAPGGRTRAAGRVAPRRRRGRASEPGDP